jgi:hypothetical protein
MATRQQLQIAQDLVRFINIVNDFMDIAGWYLRDINPNTGAARIDDVTGQPYTLQEIKQDLNNIRTSVLNYWGNISSFITQYGQQNVVDALNILGISATQVKAELDSMKGVIESVTTSVQAATDKSELPAIADYLDANVPKLPLVRRSWIEW